MRTTNPLRNDVPTLAVVAAAADEAGDRADAAIVDVRGLGVEFRRHVAEVGKRHDLVMARLDGFDGRFDQLAATLAQRDNLHRQQLAAAMGKASGARRYGAALDARISQQESENLRQKAQLAIVEESYAQAAREGHVVAEADWAKAKRRMLWGLTSTPVILAGIAILAQRCGG